MKSNLAAKPLLSGMFWAMLFVSMFTAPVIMAARTADDSDRTAELIRQHQEATSPWAVAPKASGTAGACEQSGDATQVSPEQETSMGESSPDAPMIRPVGKRSHRIQV